MKPEDPRAEIRKRINAKRQRLAQLMNEALGAFDPRDEVQLIQGLNRGRRPGKRYSADDRDIKRLPESQLDFLIEHYSGTNGPRHVW
jgi:hypothetical protein